MARARNIKPRFFDNELLGELEPLARLLFIGLWCIADREGRLEDRPKRIKKELLGYDDCDCDKLLESLHSAGFIQRYAVNGEQYIQIANFLKHQNPHQNEVASTIPPPDFMPREEALATKGESTRADSFIPHPLTLNPLTDSLTPPTPPPGEAPDGAVAAVVRAWDKISGKIMTLHESERITALVDEHGEQRVLDAIRIAGDNGQAKISYLEGILRNNGKPPQSRGQPAKKAAERTADTWLDHYEGGA